MPIIKTVIPHIPGPFLIPNTLQRRATQVGRHSRNHKTETTGSYRKLIHPGSPGQYTHPYSNSEKAILEHAA